MTPLRQRLIEEIALRGYSDKTSEAYVHAVACLAKYYGRAPDSLSDEELRGYLLQLHLKGDKARSTLNVAVSGMRFFYQRVLHRPFTHLERNLPRPRPAKRRPKAYTLAEVKRLLGPGLPQPQASRFPHDRLRRRAAPQRSLPPAAREPGPQRRPDPGRAGQGTQGLLHRAAPPAASGVGSLLAEVPSPRRLALLQHPQPAGVHARRDRTENLLPGGGARRLARQGRHPLSAPFLRHALDGSGPAALCA